MRTVGIIAEYNPFHNGHAYQIRKAKELAGADYCVAVISGDFVQRGAPAIYDKYTRTRMALSSGADLVIEMPPMFATGSAEDFAACGIAILDRLGVTDAVCFGSECGSIKPLWDAAKILCEEPEGYRKQLTDGLKRGLTFPQARAAALLPYLEGSDRLLSFPNNILGTEYCKALLRRKSRMEALTIRRTGSGYHDETYTARGSASGTAQSTAPGTARSIVEIFPTDDIQSDGRVFPSSTALREILEQPGGEPIRRHFTALSEGVPAPVLALLLDACPILTDDFSALLSQALLQLQLSGRPLTDFYDVPADLAARISRQTLEFAGFSQRCGALKTRQYTYTRVSRALLHILLGLTAQDADARKRHDYISYFRILGFRKSAEPLLSAIRGADKKAARPPMITRTAGAASILDDAALDEFRRDIYCSHLYQSVLAAKSGRRTANEYSSAVLVITD